MSHLVCLKSIENCLVYNVKMLRPPLLDARCKKHKMLSTINALLINNNDNNYYNYNYNYDYKNDNAFYLLAHLRTLKVTLQQTIMEYINK